MEFELRSENNTNPSCWELKHNADFLPLCSKGPKAPTAKKAEGLIKTQTSLFFLILAPLQEF